MNIVVNYLGVFLESIAGFFIGFLWYSVLFQKPWLKEMGITKKEMEKAKKEGGSWMFISLILGFLKTIMLALILEALFSIGLANNFFEFLIIGILVWLVIEAVILDQVLWSKNKSINLFLINSTHYLVVILVMTLVLFYI